MNQVVRCILCDEICVRTAFDQWPEYESPPGRTSEPYRTTEKDDFHDFLKQHGNHQMEHLQVIEDSFVSDKPYFEPMKASYVKATNGKEKFVIKKFRKAIDEPLTYQLIHGDYALKLLKLEIQPEAISRQLNAELNRPPLPQPRVEAFIKLYQKILKTMDIHRLERIPEDSAYPLEIYYKMDEVSLSYLLRNSRNIFKDQEYKEIEAFIHRHRDDGVLLLKAVYEIQIAEAKTSKKEAIAVPQPLKEKMRLEKK